MSEPIDLDLERKKKRVSEATVLSEIDPKDLLVVLADRVKRGELKPIKLHVHIVEENGDGTWHHCRYGAGIGWLDLIAMTTYAQNVTMEEWRGL